MPCSGQRQPVAVIAKVVAEGVELGQNAVALPHSESGIVCAKIGIACAGAVTPQRERGGKNGALKSYCATIAALMPPE